MTAPAPPSLAGKRVLVAEDEYFIADDLRRVLEQAGAVVIGPVATLAAALAGAGTEPLDAALLDVNLGGQMSYPVADRLLERAVPFVLTTGYEDWALPDRLAAAPRLPKPSSPEAVVTALARVLDAAAGGPAP